MASNRRELRKVLQKFTKQELLNIVGKSVWFKSSLRLKSLKQSQKGDLAEYFAKNIEEEKLEMVISDLSMLYMNLHPKLRVWRILKVCNEVGVLKHVRDPVTFQSQLRKYMNRSPFNCHVICQVHEEALWAYLTFFPLVTKSSKQRKDSIYLIHYPLSPYIIYTDVKALYQPTIRKAFLQLFEGTMIEDIQLTARNFHALIQLVWQKDGSVFDQQFSVPSFIPLASRGKNECQSLPSVIEHHNKGKEHKDKYIKETFGEFVQPPLEVLNLTTDTNFYGFNKETKQPTRCRIQFGGSSVIEGFRKLIEVGTAVAPLPEFIGNIGRLGQNSFHITEKPE